MEGNHRKQWSVRPSVKQETEDSWPSAVHPVGGLIMTVRTVEPAPLRMGIVSCASIAERRAAPAMASAPDVELIAVASRDPARAETFARRFGCAVEHSYQALLNRADIDALYLPLPTGMHHEWGARALNAGKHVLVEKPLAVTAEEAAHLFGLAEESGLVIRENYAFLHHAHHLAVRRAITEGVVGRPLSFCGDFGIPPRPSDDIRYRPELGGGALLDLGGYSICAAQDLLGDDLTVRGSVLRRDSSTGVDVGGSALLATPSGSTAQITFGFEHDYRSAYTVWGTLGRLMLERPYSTPDTLSQVLRTTRQGRTEEIELPADAPFRNALSDFARVARIGAVPEQEVRRSIRRAELVDEISRTQVY